MALTQNIYSDNGRCYIFGININSDGNVVNIIFDILCNIFDVYVRLFIKYILNLLFNIRNSCRVKVFAIFSSDFIS